MSSERSSDGYSEHLSLQITQLCKSNGVEGTFLYHNFVWRGANFDLKVCSLHFHLGVRNQGFFSVIVTIEDAGRADTGYAHDSPAVTTFSGSLFSLQKAPQVIEPTGHKTELSYNFFHSSEQSNFSIDKGRIRYC